MMVKKIVALLLVLALASAMGIQRRVPKNTKTAVMKNDVSFLDRLVQTVAVAREIAITDIDDAYCVGEHPPVLVRGALATQVQLHVPACVGKV